MNRHFTKEDAHMTNKYGQICSIPWPIREMKIKTMMGQHYIPIRTAEKKIVPIPNAGKESSSRTHSHCGWKCKMVQSFWKIVWLKKTNKYILKL